MATQRQYEFCHHVLGEVLWGGVDSEEGRVNGRREEEEEEGRKGWRKRFGKKKKPSELVS